MSKKILNNIEIELPASKSISNRVLIVNAISNSFEPIENLSNSDDTKSIFNVLYSNTNTFDVGEGGAPMRFLTAYLSGIVGKWIIKGSERLNKRPIAPLVEALNSIGAQITYLEEEGYPPLQIMGSNIIEKEVKVPGNISSQFISALILIAPRLKDGLKIIIEGECVSKSYINMTLSLIKDFGISYTFVNNEISIKPGAYKQISYSIESDWTAASYIYSILEISDNRNIRIKLNGLKHISTQGDKHQVELWSKLGIKTAYTNKGVFISKEKDPVKSLKYNFSEMPDLVQTFVVACCQQGVQFEFTGLSTLVNKETNRIEALCNELKKLGFILETNSTDSISWKGEGQLVNKEISIETYNDHRMAMSFAPLLQMSEKISITNPKVVSKSFPNFWEEVEKLNIVNKNRD